jgi:KDO2-lipid IV(A) lauroyltransferase
VAKKKPYRFFVYLLARFGALLLTALPRRLSLAVARIAGRLGYILISRQRDKILKSLKKAYGLEKSDKEIEAIAKNVLGHILQTAIDFLKFTRMSPEKASAFIDIGSADAFCKDILQEGKGVIIMTAHIGNWELLGAALLGLKGFRGSVVGRRIYYEPYNRWIIKLREAVGVQTIYSHEAVRKIREHLRRNEVVGLLPDQDMENVRGIFVDFFGKPAYTPMAPVKFALVTGTPILPAFLIRLKGDRYKLLLGSLIRPKIEGDREAAIRKYTEAWMKSFEEVIRQYPEQWAWMHDRWKTTPEKIDSEKQEAVSSV